MLYAVRVRGIYATALSVLLHRKGFLLSDASRIIQQRLNILYASRAPEVTVKSLEDKPDYILVIGYPWDAGEAVYKALLEELPYAVTRRGTLGLYTIADARSLGDCRVELPGGVEGRLDSGECPEPGEAVRVTIVREALEPRRSIVARSELRVVGRHAIVSRPGSGVSFSEHIRDPELKASLIALAGKIVDLDEYHVHFRSGSRLASESVIAGEVESLLSELDKYHREKPSGEPRIVRRGEFIALLGLPSPSKSHLDGLRREITPTIDRHHSIKSFSDESSSLVDCAEAQLGIGGTLRGIGIEYYLMSRQTGKKVVVEHHKPDGDLIRLGPYTVKAARFSEDVVEVDLERRLKGGGTLDGLGVEKRPGDWVKTRIRSGDWFIVHEYYSGSGNLLGVYANINTPVEFGPGRIKYFDLYIDVVKRPGGEARVIDREELDHAYSSGLITRSLYEKALETAEYMARRLSSTYP
ncbi:MAG: DUF402 domain-containing protein [Desulfurococcales archaeon]|nr:DUF402 domain-containing protein [Desulfurococcales archaeon]